MEYGGEPACWIERVCFECGAVEEEGHRAGCARATSVPSMTPRERYTHGHHESVLRSHRWRTVENSVAFVLPHLRAGMSLLDVGCGPGSITADLARRVAPGHVLGIDAAPGIIEAAAAEHVEDNLEFAVGDVYALSLPDRSVDLVLAHQVLQHLADPVAALAEMGRVVTDNGVVAVRDADFGAFTWFPEDPVLTRWMALYHEITRRNGAQCDAGRRLLDWAHQAGFTRVEVSSANWTFATPEERAFWGGLWADRVRESAFAEQALEYGLSTREELVEIAAAFERWIDEPEGTFFALNGEILARR